MSNRMRAGSHEHAVLARNATLLTLPIALLATLLLSPIATVRAQEAVAAEVQSNPPTYQRTLANWKLEHVHSFSCKAGLEASPLDDQVWEYQLGRGEEYGLPAGWGNNEPQVYTNELRNVAIRPHGSASEGCALHITGFRDGESFTSGRIRALPTHPLGKIQPQVQPDGSVRAVRIAARMQLPAGALTGIWPAFWMLSTSQVYGGWAASGEIDIMEAVKNELITHATVHFGGEWPGNLFKGTTIPCASGNCRDGFHEWAIEWRHSGLKWLIDDVVLYEMVNTDWSTTAANAVGNDAAPFDKPFSVLLNLALGGIFPGDVDPNAVFPQVFLVDYITVHREMASI